MVMYNVWLLCRMQQQASVSPYVNLSGSMVCKVISGVYMECLAVKSYGSPPTHNSKPPKISKTSPTQNTSKYQNKLKFLSKSSRKLNLNLKHLQKTNSNKNIFGSGSLKNGDKLSRTHRKYEYRIIDRNKPYGQ